MRNDGTMKIRPEWLIPACAQRRGMAALLCIAVAPRVTDVALSKQLRLIVFNRHMAFAQYRRKRIFLKK